MKHSHTDFKLSRSTISLGFEASNSEQDLEVLTKDFIIPWIRTCHHSLNGGDHLTCATRNGVVRLPAVRDTPPLPSRVIDVGLDAERPRLHVTGNSSFKSKTLRRRHRGFGRESSRDDDDGDHEYRPSRFEDEEKEYEKELAKYLILSYCWGKNNTALTTKANISQRQEGIDLESLPKTIRDAIQITRSIGERYLFVDALCIIQPTDGDTTDWQAEASRMGAYYENALCTIAATGASDSKDGCLFERPGLRFPSVPCYLPPWTKAGTSQTICINPSIPLWWVCVIDAPLYQRGWTVQERAMSRRTLHFTKDALYFECAGLRASEYRPSGLHEEEARAIHENLAKEVHLSLGRMRKYSRSEIFGWAWFRLLERYSWLKFTYSADRLVALSGMAKRIKIHWPDTYCAGLWRERLVEGLAWHTRGYDKQGPKALSDYVAPSWSWASVDAVLKFSVVGVRSWLWLAEVVDVKLISTTADDCGQLSGGRLRIKGVLQELHLLVRPKTDDTSCLWFETPNTLYDTPSTQLWFDTPRDSALQNPFLTPCLLLGSEELLYPIREVSRLIFMVLEPTGNAKNEYKRIGFAETYKTFLYCVNEEKSEIEII